MIVEEARVSGGPRSLDEARKEIARLEREVDDLRRRLMAEPPETDLREGLRLAATTGLLSSPVTHGQLLKMIVETAAHVMAARGGSLLLLDDEGDELVFEVAVGSEGDELAGMRLDLGQGIAGLVAVSGQPMAISDAESDPRVASDIARSVGYVPHDLLCVPLFYDDRVIGVLELVDKEDGASFTGADIESLGLFANQAAVAIRQSRVHHSLAGDVEDDDDYRQAVGLAELVHQIVSHGGRELQACHEILRSFADYLRSQPRSEDEL
jgi:signal transduction protein with GAF and PtsI domain